MTSPERRLAYIDWMRGLACVLMFETHCYDSWLSAEAKKTEFFRYSQMGGTLPAPLFIFLAGVSVALVTEKLRGKGIARGAIAKQVMWRGAEVFGLGILFRVQEFILGIPISPWTDLLRVDVLNILGLSMILLGVLCWVAEGGDGVVAAMVRTWNLVLALAAAAVVAIVTPALWTTWRPRFLPWQVESYVNGVRICGIGGGILVVYGFCQATGGVGILGVGVGGSSGVWRGFGVGSLGACCVCGVRLLAYESEFFSGAVRNDRGDFVFCLCMVPAGTGAGGV